MRSLRKHCSRVNLCVRLRHYNKWMCVNTSEKRELPKNFSAAPSSCWHMFVTSMAFLSIINISVATMASTLPPSTTIPVIILDTVDAGKAKPGHEIKAKTMQLVRLPSGASIPKGSMVLGHVSQVHWFPSEGKPSSLTIVFDKIFARGQAIHLHVFVRAMADVFSTQDAMGPELPSDMNFSNTVSLIGGDEVTPGEKTVVSANGDTDKVGVNVHDGVFSRLRPSSYLGNLIHYHCSGTDTLQSVAIYSADACGVYGFPDTDLVQNGLTTPDGDIKLTSTKHRVSIHSGTSMLLQVFDDKRTTFAPKPSGPSVQVDHAEL